ncbi:MAG: sigma-54-dependent Fis family transcriptional regulator [Myxococcota bacterium]
MLASLRMSRLSLLVDLASLIPREVDLDALLQTACERLATAMDAERATLWLVDAEEQRLMTRVAVLPEVPALHQPLTQGIAGHVARTGEVVRVSDAAKDPRFDPSADRATGYRTRSMLVVPVRESMASPVRGVVQVLNRHQGTFDEEDERYLGALAIQLGNVLSLTTLRAADVREAGVVVRGPFNHIVGRSPAMESVYERVGLAAETDATVLLRGETGTGKTLFARAVHVNSGRQAGPFVTVDCTTLPGQLVESELFGHERGAFTGADRRVRGMVEMAEGGTLFLDEIGDLPLESQGKLLRFLQERSFERIGGRQTLTADVRLICATHRDLETSVAEGRFREDLYYRIRVVEIDVPSLRERGPEEVLRLAQHFADRAARKHGRPTPRLTKEVLALLREHQWPGNVRELEHWIESAIVLAPDGVVKTRHLPSPRRVRRKSVTLPLGETLDEVTRRYVEATVDACGSKVRAAESLEIGRNTVTRILKKE